MSMETRQCLLQSSMGQGMVRWSSGSYSKGLVLGNNVSKIHVGFTVNVILELSLIEECDTWFSRFFLRYAI